MILNIPQNALFAMLFILGLLMAATLSLVFLKAKVSDKTYRELSQRITSWWWIIGLLFVFLAINTNAAIVFFGFISFLALKEFLSIVPTRQADRSVVFYAYLAIPVQYYWVADAWYGMFIIFIPVYMFLFIPMRMVLKGETTGFIKAAGICTGR